MWEVFRDSQTLDGIGKSIGVDGCNGQFQMAMCWCSDLPVKNKWHCQF